METATSLAFELTSALVRGSRPARLARAGRRAIAVVCSIVLAVVVMAGVGVPIYVLPHLDTPTRSDAVIVLGPPTVQRLKTAQGLVNDGLASTIVVSVPPGVREDDAHPRVRDMCSGRSTYDVVCFTPNPFTTQGEARAAEALMAEHSWDSIIVVTSVSHVTRSRVLFDRCLTGARTSEFVSDQRDYDLARWIAEYVYQTAAFIKVAAAQDC
ncbi:YdcF family protein [Herbiconiux sp. A18JL235]|uniref:YdcF family protein n=1 Tax=Herbiconiux sp. A18JL235 TaxID=3152363 RepID=A0AB39BJ26_9MICO